ncbi:MAG TPA: hypothetical protein VMG60_19295 [Burkholderiaceae bacterium]|nr:hypothetical protein [Burkholderiaceae bacterium]
MRPFLIGVCLTCAAQAVHAIEVDAAECREGAQFISNAAQSRKNGATKEMFVGKLDEDLFVLENVPPELRWFAHGEAEATFLREAVIDVFEFPRDPSQHAHDFLASCLRSAGLENNLADVPAPAPAEDDPGDWGGHA